ncbi:hypothetical protein TTHERM_00281010 (macronuclear) [Tetrahymena thermophila SB210]|uniref:Uncharacterized protein n=1 Tax=Tetrahymena thermophila (strain SB210) TaxID=312017 RepID=I7M8E2_TETTS|nr:hypothetical protein TTHERM_00281010 [Tetrahymena thermophila SB210]EAR97911.2 hypothetical protein TTHERM_00281010 [Tetrahymena thermophila SB210]|eukprot:XP_001018156.2 hypothetical protein TTHERM_00281010 [Tetrahymena thermophila SB210]
MSMLGVISREESTFLKEINLFYFNLLEIQLQWDDFQKYVNSKSQNGKAYYEQLENGFSFSSDQNQYIFFKSNEKKPNDYSVEKYPYHFYDDRKYAISALTYDNILFYKQFLKTLEKLNQQKLEKQMDQQKVQSNYSNDYVQNCETIAYLCKQNLQRDIYIQNMNQNKFQQDTMFPLSPLTKANYIMQAMGSTRVFKNVNEIQNWQRWKVYWFTKNHPVYCYSTCSGSCTAYCQGTPCIYVLPQNELESQGLPDAEKVDPRNIFSDDLYFLAYQLNIYTINILQ